MNREKQILDYREPFNAPYMIREIAKNVNLPFVVYAQDFTVATVSFALVFSCLLLLFGMNQLVIMISKLYDSIRRWIFGITVENE